MSLHAYASRDSFTYFTGPKFGPPRITLEGYIQCVTFIRLIRIIIFMTLMSLLSPDDREVSVIKYRLIVISFIISIFIVLFAEIQKHGE